jgi:EAL domain-containing protein (putative c-di-GMP-specific phosphodiesterase class I)
LRAALSADLYVAVNLSARQTYDARLFDTIVAIIERTGLPPVNLRLELTESLLMRDFTFTGALLQRLREHLGTRIAIDDFGTGYSSLSYLKQLPIDTLKVDRSFVRDIPNDSSDIEITSAVIAMARALSKDVIAEGVETPAQLGYLKSQGCGFAQGYLLGRPAPPAQFTGGPLCVPVDG